MEVSGSNMRPESRSWILTKTKNNSRNSKTYFKEWSTSTPNKDLIFLKFWKILGFPSELGPNPLQIYI